MRNAAAFLFVLLLSAAAIAGPKDDADQAIARGIAFRRQGDDAAALKEFQRAQEVSPTPRATAQVGLAL
jgi:Flp pilus assembly protein TadD